MKSYVLEEIVDLKINKNPLKLVELKKPEIEEEDEIIVKVDYCGVCHTELDEIEGRLLPSFFPIVLGHQIVGKVIERGEKVKKFKINERVGAGWIYSSCGMCEFCKGGFENLCPNFKGTGKDANGGYAEFFKIKENFAFSIPKEIKPEKAAPLFCAGAIGYRSLNLAKPEDRQNAGLVGFGASGHLVLKMIKYLYPSTKVFVFSRTEKERELALKLGAFWAGDIDEKPKEKLHFIIDTTPVWKPPFLSLKYLNPKGKLIINAIRKENFDKEYLLNLNYSEDLWLEKEIKTVANVTRGDIEEFLKISSLAKIEPEIDVYEFEKANEALRDIYSRKIKGAKVLKISN